MIGLIISKVWLRIGPELVYRVFKDAIIFLFFFIVLISSLDVTKDKRLTKNIGAIVILESIKSSMVLRFLWKSF